ncbi:histidine phosphatase family protein [Cognaticolwellia mytili]|uniref:histidine phosphatase family protein n=1 Tax=Cognaticolwellia mytili TaxID=1888913 RepID=UPI000A176721|nr:histidine phosphatase family protein [Cognaticolwellia mytili]
MKTKLYLARHGQTLWNKVQRFQGQLDSELTAVGKQQSENIAQQLADKNIDLIVSSSLGRAIASARICQQQLNVPVINVDDLIERNLGHWQGEHVDDIKSDKNYHEILHQFTELKPVDGESAVQCGTRIYQTLQSLAENNQNKNILVIFHGEALRCLLAKLGESSTDNAYDLFDNGCLLTLTYQHQKHSFQLIDQMADTIK